MPSRELVPALLAALALSACKLDTDQDRYGVGEVVQATFENLLPIDVFFGNCPPFVVEKLEGERWVAQLDAVPCLLSLNLHRVPPQGRYVYSFIAPEPGAWRISMAAGVGCEEPETGFGTCRRIFGVSSQPFEVTSPGGGCFVGGCNHEFCADEPLLGPCWWFPEFTCYRDAACGRFGDPEVSGGCDWKRTPELAACLEELEGPGDLVPLPLE